MLVEPAELVAAGSCAATSARSTFAKQPVIPKMSSGVAAWPIARNRTAGTDAVALVANCRLGKRALKFHDWGKVAATFVDLPTGRAIRIAAKESSKQRAREMFPALDKEAGQQQTYRAMPEDELFEKQWVRVEVREEDLPGFKGPRVVCAQCGEGINFKREVVVEGRTLCRSCAGQCYYTAF